MIFVDDFLVSFYAGKMSNIRALVNQANQKVSGQSSASKKRDERRDRTTDAWFPMRVHDEPEEEEDIPLKGRGFLLSTKVNRFRPRLRFSLTVLLPQVMVCSSFPGCGLSREVLVPRPFCS